MLNTEAKHAHLIITQAALLVVSLPPASPCQSLPFRASRKAFLLSVFFFFTIQLSLAPCLPWSLCQTQVMVADSLATADSEQRACACSNLGGLHGFPHQWMSSSQLCRLIFAVVTTPSIHSARQRKAINVHPKNVQKTPIKYEKQHQFPDFQYVYVDRPQAVTSIKHALLSNVSQLDSRITRGRFKTCPCWCPIPGHSDSLCLGCSLARTMLIWKPLKQTCKLPSIQQRVLFLLLISLCSSYCFTRLFKD